jgi:hypothetical protein
LFILTKNDGISITQEGIIEGCPRLFDGDGDGNEASSGNINQYCENAKRLQSLACYGPNMGCNAACDHIIFALHNGVTHLCDSKKYLQLTGHQPFVFTFISGVILIAVAYSIGAIVTAYIAMQ